VLKREGVDSLDQLLKKAKQADHGSNDGSIAPDLPRLAADSNLQPDSRLCPSAMHPSIANRAGSEFHRTDAKLLKKEQRTQRAFAGLTTARKSEQDRTAPSVGLPHPYPG
jgi:hypothetical protein